MFNELVFWQQAFLAALAVGGGAAAALVVGFFGRRKVSAETTDLIVSASGNVVDMLNGELKVQMKKRMDLEQELRKALAKIEENATELARLTDKVALLELWITNNTDMDPDTIHGRRSP